LRIGYLHLGPPEGGLYRYSRLLAAEAGRRPGLKTVAADLPTILRCRNDVAALGHAARQLGTADIVHLQHNMKVWGGPQRGRQAVAALRRHCSVPLVVTLHDVYPSYDTAEMLRRSATRLTRRVRSAVRAVTTRPRDPAAPAEARQAADPTMGWRRGAIARSLRDVTGRAAAVIVCTEVERDRLGSIDLSTAISVVPHFVEVRANLPCAAAARRQLGVQHRHVVTLLGMIVARKGHRLLLDAMDHLPADVLVVLAGGAAVGGADYVTHLTRQIETRGLVDRVRLTGYLTEDNLEQWLAATDLAVCPFSAASASGSLATWISVAKPVVASDLPQIAEINRTVPDAIGVFRPYTATALAAAIRRHLAVRRTCPDPAVARLRELRALPTVFDRHLDLYRQVAGHRRSSSVSRGTPS
jgi:glycosyltransferase involved in cell wall biosynthesis